MKLVSFERDGKAGFGVVVGDGVVDLCKALGGRHADLKSLLASDAMGEAREAAKRSPDFGLADVTLLPVIPNPGKIWCAGLNYGEHVQETGRRNHRAARLLPAGGRLSGRPRAVAIRAAARVEPSSTTKARSPW